VNGGSGRLGLDGKVARVSGGGAAARASATGRAAAILLAKAGARVVVGTAEPQARRRRTVENDRSVGGQGHRGRWSTSPRSARLRGHVRRPWSASGGSTCSDNNGASASRGSVVDLGEGRVAARDAGQRRDDVPRRQARDSRHEARRRRRHRQRLVDLPAAPARPTAYRHGVQGAVIALTRAMAVDHGREGIRVNCVAPGPSTRRWSTRAA